MMTARSRALVLAVVAAAGVGTAAFFYLRAGTRALEFQGWVEAY